MKKYLTLTLMGLGVALASCNSKNGLANEMAGSWSGSPERVEAAQSAQIPTTVTTTDTYDFTTEKDIAGGTVTIAGVLSISAPLETANGGYEVSAAGNATISGTWNVIDDDDVEMILDPRSLTVEIDPDALELRTNTLGEQAPEVDSIAPGLKQQLKQLMSGIMGEHYLSQRHLEDVKVRDNTLKFEIDREKAKDKVIVLRRQQ